LLFEFAAVVFSFKVTASVGPFELATVVVASKDSIVVVGFKFVVVIFPFEDSAVVLSFEGATVVCVFEVTVDAVATLNSKQAQKEILNVVLITIVDALTIRWIFL